MKYIMAAIFIFLVLLFIGVICLAIKEPINIVKDDDEDQMEWINRYDKRL